MADFTWNILCTARSTKLLDVLLLIVLLHTVTAQQGVPPTSEEDGESMMTSACGPEEMLLSAENPEFMFTFPHDEDSHGPVARRSIARRSIYVRGRIQTNGSADSGANQTANRTAETGRSSFYSCKWVITTDTAHAISAIFEFSSEYGFSLSAEDDDGFIANCTTRRCLIESTTPALSLEFRTARVDNQPSTKFIAKLYSTYTAPDDLQDSVDWWLLLLSSSALLTFLCGSYLFYMKRSLLLARIFRLLNNAVSDSPSKTAQVKKAPPSNGCAQPTTPTRRQHRTSMCSGQGTTFEPMPTITEEDNEVMDCDTVSDVYSEKKNSLVLPHSPPAIRVV